MIWLWNCSECVCCFSLFSWHRSVSRDIEVDRSFGANWSAANSSRSFSLSPVWYLLYGLLRKNKTAAVWGRHWTILMWKKGLVVYWATLLSYPSSNLPRIDLRLYGLLNASVIAFQKGAGQCHHASYTEEAHAVLYYKRFVLSGKVECLMCANRMLLYAKHSTSLSKPNLRPDGAD